MAAPLVGTVPSDGVSAYPFSRWTALLLGFGFGVYAYTLFDKMWVGELPISIYEHQVVGQGTVLEVRRGLSAFDTICYVLEAWLILS
jgi:hypothetical protein